ncbi:MAG: 1-phosphofructokinase family hexose kinase [Solirubrobacteraceae bacterium]
MRLSVFAASPLLTITIEPGHERAEVHLHAGGQGVWVARLAATLGAEVVLCCALGGEPGRVIRGLLDSEPLTMRAVAAEGANGVYIHDRRAGSRQEVVHVPSPPLTRHAADELYGVALGAGLDADLMLLTGTEPADIIDPDLYRRLASDLRRNGTRVIADLTGPPLRAALSGGIELLKISHEELVQESEAASGDIPDLLAGARRLRDTGARHVLVSRAGEPALLFGEDPDVDVVALHGPVFEALDNRGTGDSMFAAIGVGLARGLSIYDAVRLGAAAGALNATRRGLGTGTREEIEGLATHITIAPLLDDAA